MANTSITDSVDPTLISSIHTINNLNSFQGLKREAYPPMHPSPKEALLQESSISTNLEYQITQKYSLELVLL